MLANILIILNISSSFSDLCTNVSYSEYWINIIFIFVITFQIKVILFPQDSELHSKPFKLISQGLLLCAGENRSHIVFHFFTGQKKSSAEFYHITQQRPPSLTPAKRDQALILPDVLWSPYQPACMWDRLILIKYCSYPKAMQHTRFLLPSLLPFPIQGGDYFSG